MKNIYSRIASKKRVNVRSSRTIESEVRKEDAPPSDKEKCERCTFGYGRVKNNK